MINERVLKILLNQLKTNGVSIQDSDKWSYDIHAKIIYYNNDDLYKMSFIDIVGMLMHEVGHVRFSESISNTLNKYTSISQHGTKLAVNIFEDMRIEEKMRGQYPYAKTFLPKGHISKDMAKKVFHQIKKLQEIKFKDEDMPKLVQYGLVVGLYFGGEEFLAMNLLKKFDIEVGEAFEKTKDYIDACFYIDSFPLLEEYLDKRILPHIKKFLEEFDKSDAAVMVVIKSESNIPTTTSDFSDICNDVYDGSGIRKYNEIVQDVKNIIKPLRFYVDKVLRDTRFDRYEGSYTRGLLNKRKIHKIDFLNNRIFKQKTELKNKYYEFGLIVDHSGSMYGKKFYNAMNGMVLFIEALRYINTIKISLLGFSTENIPIKKMLSPENEKMIDRSVEAYYRKALRNMGGTRDFDALKEMFDEFTVRDKTKRLVVILTDGESGSEGDLKKILSRYKMSGVEVIAVGIDITEKQMSKHYSKRIIVKTPSEIPKEFYKIIKSTIKR